MYAYPYGINSNGCVSRQEFDEVKQVAVNLCQQRGIMDVGAKASI